MGSLGQGLHVVPYGPASLGLGHGTAASSPCSVPKEGGARRGDMLAAKVAERFFSLGRNILNTVFFFFLKAYKLGAFLVLEP